MVRTKVTKSRGVIRLALRTRSSNVLATRLESREEAIYIGGINFDASSIKMAHAKRDVIGKEVREVDTRGSERANYRINRRGVAARISYEPLKFTK